MKNRTKKARIPFILKLLMGLILLASASYLFLRFIPIEGLDKFLNQQYSTRFYDRNGKLLHIMPLENGLRKEYYPLSELPEELIQDFIKEEDSAFFHHPGVNPFAILRAAKQNKNEGWENIPPFMKIFLIMLLESKIGFSLQK